MPNIYQFKDFEGSSHRILIDLIGRFAPLGQTLVDLGAAGGELGEAVRKGFGRSFGFELDAHRIEQLRTRFDHAVITDLETISRLPRNVSVAVMADVLEHLRDPRQLLRLVRRSLGPEGLLFVSVPNIANITIRLGLLFGVFTYRERGILDSTHLRFYTLRTLRRELSEEGFEIVALRGSSIPVRLIVGTRVPDRLLRIVEAVVVRVTQLWKALFAYQIIVVAKRRQEAE